MSRTDSCARLPDFAVTSGAAGSGIDRGAASGATDGLTSVKGVEAAGERSSWPTRVCKASARSRSVRSSRQSQNELATQTTNEVARRGESLFMPASSLSDGHCARGAQPDSLSPLILQPALPAYRLALRAASARASNLRRCLFDSAPSTHLTQESNDEPPLAPRALADGRLPRTVLVAPVLSAQIPPPPPDLGGLKDRRFCTLADLQLKGTPTAGGIQLSWVSPDPANPGIAFDVQ